MNKVTLGDIEELNAPQLIMNIALYNENTSHLEICDICRKYSDLSIEALKKKWQEDWGDFDYLVKKLKKNDKQYINTSRYSSENMHQIIDFIKKYNKKK